MATVLYSEVEAKMSHRMLSREEIALLNQFEKASRYGCGGIKDVLHRIMEWTIIASFTIVASTYLDYLDSSGIQWFGAGIILTLAIVYACSAVFWKAKDILNVKKSRR